MAGQPVNRQVLQEEAARRRERYLGELLDFLRIPSISALPEHAGDVRRAARWVADRMAAAGFEHVQVMETGGHPVVYGDRLRAPGRPTVLIYGHFDTQPADPVEAWSHPPFEPVVREGRVYARGACDDKGNMLIPILAVEMLLALAGELPVNVKCLFEGQEEIGSPQLPDFVAAHRTLLACDLVVSADGEQLSEHQPSLTIASRGLVALQVEVQGPASDLHSGLHGGAVQNPIHALAALLASLHGPDGRVRVDGFYDRVKPLSEEDRAQLAAIPFDEEAYRQELQVPQLFGEAGYTTLERQRARPTVEVNGIWGGFQGEGVKTVLPARAGAKITSRLVPDQDPQEILDGLTRHILRHAPPGVTVKVRPLGGMARPYFMPADHWANRVAARVLEELYGRPPVYIRTGGTVPVYELFLRHLGAYTVTFAFGLPDERIHAPDEFFRIDSFQRGLVAHALLLQALAAEVR